MNRVLFCAIHVLAVSYGFRLHLKRKAPDRVCPEDCADIFQSFFYEIMDGDISAEEYEHICATSADEAINGTICNGCEFCSTESQQCVKNGASLRLVVSKWGSSCKQPSNFFDHHLWFIQEMARQGGPGTASQSIPFREAMCGHGTDECQAASRDVMEVLARLDAVDDASSLLSCVQGITANTEVMHVVDEYWKVLKDQSKLAQGLSSYLTREPCSDASSWFDDLLEKVTKPCDFKDLKVKCHGDGPIYHQPLQGEKVIWDPRLAEGKQCLELMGLYGWLVANPTGGCPLSRSAYNLEDMKHGMTSGRACVLKEEFGGG